jgi:hypothetical protein
MGTVSSLSEDRSHVRLGRPSPHAGQDVPFRHQVALEEERKALSRKPAPTEYAERFLELAEQSRKAPACFDALNWVLR